MFEYTLWKCFERNFQWSSVNILWVEVFYISDTGRPLQIFANGGLETNIYKIVFCGSYRLTTYCEALAPAASDLSK